MKYNFEAKKVVFAILALVALIGAFALVRKTRIPFLGKKNWRKVQERAHNSVVQIFVDLAYFNWTEPYKSPEQSRSVGSGFFINEQGYIVSNFHVVDEATTVKIQIPALGKERFEVTIVGVCPQADVALLKLSDESLADVREKLGEVRFLELGDSDKVVRTQELLALGYPLGQEKLKSTKGIVSGRERVWGESYLQITAPINEGSSGGPSLNNDGKVIGINTASISRAENVGYIIPINDVKHIIKTLYEKKFLRKPILGCEFNIATEEMVTYLKNPEPGGMFVSRVYDGSIMQKAGVHEGDMIYKVNGYDVDRYGEVLVPWSEDKVHFGDVVNRFNIGESIPLVLHRKGKKITTDLHFSFINLLPIRSMYPEYEKIDYEIIGGMVIMELKLNHLPLFKRKSPYLVRFYRKENQYESRLIMTHVFPGSQTKLARSVFAGDVIEYINNKPVKTLEDFRKVIMESRRTGYVVVKSRKRNVMVLSLDKILKDEDRLAKIYMYKKSDLCGRLL